MGELIRRLAFTLFAAALLLSLAVPGLASDDCVLKKITSEPKGTVGSPVQVLAVFSNGGDAPVQAKLEAEVQKDKRILHVLESSHTEVPPHRTVIINSSFIPRYVGVYEISGHIIYSQKVTPVKRMVVTVLSGPDSEFSGSTTVPLAVSGALAVLIAGCVLFMRRYK